MLDFNQQAVVDYRGHCLCIAGPGSGKTRTIIAKVGSLWEERSGGICIVTFTRAATEEIKERIRLEHGAEVAKGVAVGTFHKLCITMLKRANRLGKIVQSSEQRNYVLRAMDEVGFPGEYEDAVAEIERYKTSLTNTEDKTGVVGAYQGFLKKARCCDLIDVIANTVKLMQSGEIAPLKAANLLIDEYQDCDWLQYEWIRCHAKAGSNITVVGDDDQTIYGFRRSIGFEGITQFKNEFSAKEIHLNVNYRSHQEIIELSDKLIRNNAGRVFKEYHSFRGPGGEVQGLAPAGEDGQIEEIIDYVRSKGFELSPGQQGVMAVKKGGLAVIARTNHCLTKLVIRMRSEGIVFKYDRKVSYPAEVGVLFMLLASIEEPSVNAVYSGLHYIGVPTAFLRQLCNDRPDDAIRLNKGAKITIKGLDAELQKRVDDFASRLKAACSVREAGEVDFSIEIIERLMLNFFDPEIHSKPSKNLMMYVCEVLKKISGSLTKRVRRLDSPMDDRGAELGNEDELGPVELHTMHSCKGLEFDVVYITDVSEEIIPAKKAFDLEEERRLLFVAITRAKQKAIVCCPTGRNKSAFAGELGINFMAPGCREVARESQ